jgi:hypothetical protein
MSNMRTKLNHQIIAITSDLIVSSGYSISDIKINQYNDFQNLSRNQKKQTA